MGEGQMIQEWEERRLGTLEQGIQGQEVQGEEKQGQEVQGVGKPEKGEHKRRLKDRWRKWFRKDNLIILILAGILLFIIALPTKEDGEDTGGIWDGEGLMDPIHGAIQSVSVENGIAAKTMEQETADMGAQSALDEYAAMQEEKLKTLLSAMQGVGQVEVMLTFLSSEELVVEKDAPTVRSNTVEKDSEGGTRTVTQYEMGDSTVYQGSSGENEPYVVKTLNPRVEGVLVVAEGAGDGTVNRNITEIAQALFGVEAHKVKVVPMGRGSQGNGAGDDRPADNLPTVSGNGQG